MSKRKLVSRAKDYFRGSRLARLLEGSNLVVECVPSAGEDMGASNDYINFLRSGFDGTVDLCNTFAAWRKSGGKSSQTRRNSRPAALQRPQRCCHKRAINSDDG